MFVISCLLLLALTIPCTTAINCPTGYSYDGDDLCYLTFAGPYTFNEAQSHCSASGGFVATIESDEHFGNAQNRTVSGRKYFVHAVGSGGSFTWADGAQINKKYWLPEEPNATAGSCVAFANQGAEGSGLAVVSCTSMSDLTLGVLCYARPSGECISSQTYNRGTLTITSLNYPNHYNNDMNCTTTISSQLQNGTVNAIFTDYRVESPWDYVTLFDGPNTNSRQIAKIIDSTPNKTMNSNSYQMTILFSTDSTNTDAGWSADFYAGTSTTPQHYGASGSLHSKNFPSDYDNYIAQFYYFDYGNYKFNFTFTNFVTERNYDFVTFYEGNPPTKTRQFTGSPTVPFSYQSTIGNVIMVFSTDSSGALTGWNMTYNYV